MSFETAVHTKAIQLDRASLDMCTAAGSGHPTSSMSIGHIVTVLMYHVMRWLPDHPGYPSSDRLVLSEGHAVPVVYAALADLGARAGYEGNLCPLTNADLQTLRETDSCLDGHPNPMEGMPFFDAATGSLGQGLSVAAGLAAAAKGDGLDRRIYCIIGDGEAREGQIWEAIDFMVDHGLTNLLPLFNCNQYGQSDTVSEQQSPERLAAKLEAAGLHVQVIDGHDPEALRVALLAFTEGTCTSKSPAAIVARTVKGWGAPCLQGQGWHGKPPTGSLLEQAQQELQATAAEHAPAQSAEGDHLTIFPPTEYHAPPASAQGYLASLPEAAAQFDMSDALKSGRLATRKAYGIALRVLGHADPNVYVLDADTRNSTFAETFAKDEALAPRYLECKIGEQNMISVSAGLSAAGKTPFCSSFGKFLTRGYDQIEMAINSGANLKLVGSHCGISLAADGPSQMALPDISWFRSFTTMIDHHGGPGCYLLQPSDAYAAYGLTIAMAEHHGCCYMRTFRPDVECLYDENTIFNLGKFEVLTEGRDLLIVTAGFMVHECNKALESLDKAGIDATLVDLYSIPFDKEGLLDLANENGGNILTVEDNYGGGLGSAVADACTASGDGFTVEQLHLARIPKSARTEEDILQQCGLDHASITTRAATMMGVAIST